MDRFLFPIHFLPFFCKFFLQISAGPPEQLGFPCTNISNSHSFGCSKPTRKLAFFAIGDIGGKEEEDGSHHPTEGQLKVAQLMEEVAGQQSAEGLHFVLNLGDNFYEDGVTFADVKQRFNENFFQLYYGVGSESVPWYTIAGNNDHKSTDGIRPQIEFPTGKWTFPASKYSVHYNFGPNLEVQARFIMIDSTILCGKSRKEFTDPKKPLELRREKIRESKKHFRWLKKELEMANRIKDSSGSGELGVHFLFVVGHYPCYVSRGERAFGCSRRLQKLLRHYRVSAYFAGHEHNLKMVMAAGEKQRESGVAQIVAGAGSRMESANSEKHVPEEYRHMPKFWYPDSTPKETIMDGGGFVGVELDSETMEATVTFYAAGHSYPSRNTFIHLEKGVKFTQIFKIKSRRN